MRKKGGRGEGSVVHRRVEGAIMNAECLNKEGKNEQADEDVSERADNGKQ